MGVKRLGIARSENAADFSRIIRNNENDDVKQSPSFTFAPLKPTKEALHKSRTAAKQALESGASNSHKLGLERCMRTRVRVECVHAHVLQVSE